MSIPFRICRQVIDWMAHNCVVIGRKTLPPNNSIKTNKWHWYKWQVMCRMFHAGCGGQHQCCSGCWIGRVLREVDPWTPWWCHPMVLHFGAARILGYLHSIRNMKKLSPNSPSPYILLDKEQWMCFWRSAEARIFDSWIAYAHVIFLNETWSETKIWYFVMW